MFVNVLQLVLPTSLAVFIPSSALAFVCLAVNRTDDIIILRVFIRDFVVLVITAIALFCKNRDDVADILFL